MYLDGVYSGGHVPNWPVSGAHVPSGPITGDYVPTWPVSGGLCIWTVCIPGAMYPAGLYPEPCDQAVRSECFGALRAWNLRQLGPGPHMLNPEKLALKGPFFGGADSRRGHIN
jgi:hypothetical protein